MSAITRAIYMGTPAFAVPALRALHALPGVEIVGVVTRIDKPKGRSGTLTAPPVKEVALELGLPVLQPGSLRKPEAQALLRTLMPDVIIVAAFGQILPAEVLDLPPHGCLNIHASLLPRYRGASPITAVLLDGLAETGNTIMKMDVGLDTGAIIAQQPLLIAADETTATLTAKLAEQGARLLTATLPHWLAGEITPIPQDEAQATMTRLIRKEDGTIDWNDPADVIARKVRAYTPWPGSQTTWRGQPVKIIETAESGSSFDMFRTQQPTDRVPGRLVDIAQPGNLGLGVECGDGRVLALNMVQLAGKRAVTIADFMRGQHDVQWFDERLGS